MNDGQKIAVVSGHSKGLGLAMAKEFKKHGFLIVGVARTADDGKTADLFIPCDLSDRHEVTALVMRLKEMYNSIDVLINNAGVGAYATWQELGEDEIRKIMEVDFFTPLALTMGLLEPLGKASGTVINISSAAGLVAIPCMGIYSAAKFALLAFSESLRSEVKKSGVKVLSVMPGRISTGFGSHCIGPRRPPKPPGQRSATAERFASKVYASYVKGRRSLIYPWFYQVFPAIVALFPAFFENENIKRWKL